MMNNSKILTVSYGTFSCTLEGFDDSFGTMKAIAEYFRDLASDDRYFGAEPPQPDAEMLARIAEKEVSRRVAAREQDGKIVLSALEDAAPIAAAALTAAGSEKPAEEDKAPDAIAPDAVDAPAVATLRTDAADDSQDAAADAQPVEISYEVDADAVTDDVAAVMADDSAAVAEAAPFENARLDVDIPASDAGVSEADMPDIVPGQPDADVEAFFDAEAAEDHALAEELAQEKVVQAPVAPAPDSIAAKLQRIRAVVSQQSDSEDTPDYSEDEHAENGNGDPLAAARADIEEALEVDEETYGAAEDTMPQDPQTPVAAEAEEDADDLTALLNRVSATEDAPAADAESAASHPPATAEENVNNLFDEAAPEAKAAQAPVAAPRARVIKVKRAELEAALEQSDLEEVAEQAVDTPVENTLRTLDDLAPAKGAETTLTAEDEADLLRELSELEEDIEAEDTAPAVDEAAPAQAPAPRGQLPQLDADQDTDVNRLLAETDQQMGEAENTTRRDAFAHMRAAVAARNADASIDADEAKRKGDGAYREDLAEVVRPRRPVSSEARTDRPEHERPAPLKLVAEQRIDVENAKPSGPVRPRRVAAKVGEDTAAADGDSFTTFAEEMGAHSLPDLLEAAAAYLSFVEGREQFSRPQLMTKVRQAGGEDGFSREEGLRSFGQLLRAGKIEKIKGGRFTVSDDIGFRPDARAAG